MNMTGHWNLQPLGPEQLPSSLDGHCPKSTVSANGTFAHSAHSRVPAARICRTQVHPCTSAVCQLQLSIGSSVQVMQRASPLRYFTSLNFFAKLSCWESLIYCTGFHSALVVYSPGVHALWTCSRQLCDARPVSASSMIDQNLYCSFRPVASGEGPDPEQCPLSGRAHALALPTR